MKRTLFALILLVFISTPVILFSQGKRMTCDYSNYADRHNSDQARNQLLDSACVEINSGRYTAAYNLLKAVANIDSLATGEPDAFVSQQIDKLKRQIDEFGDAPVIAEKTPTDVPAETSAEKKDQDETSGKKKDDIAKESKKAAKEKKESKKKLGGSLDKISEAKGKTTEASKEAVPVKEEPAIEKPAIEKPSAEVQNKEPEIKVDEVKPVKDEPVVEKPEPVIEKENDVKPEEPKETLKTEAGNHAEQTEPGASVSGDHGVDAEQKEPDKTFTEAELIQFQNKGLQKVKLLEGYLQQVGSKNTSAAIALDAADNAKLLFDSEDRTVQVSNLKEGTKPRFKIGKYLERLRMLKYDDISIEWADFQYTSDFIKGTDGNYHGYIIFRQRFTGYKDNQLAYEDITTKKTEVILKIYSKAVGGVESDNFDVLLGDISVEQTQKN